MTTLRPKSIWLAVFLLLATTTVFASGPSPATWIMQVSATYDTAYKTHSLIIQWRNGEVSESHPIATHYEVYRSMVGHNRPTSEYEKVATISASVQSDGFIQYEDVDILPAQYYYYVVGLTDGTRGDESEISMAGAPGSYCVNLENPIIYMMTSPATVAQNNDEYVYQAYGQHRSFRVQGWVRYNLVEGPTGMVIDELTGSLSWTVPSNPDKQYKVKIRVTAPDESDAETFQEWTIRIVSDYESLVYNPKVTSVHRSEEGGFAISPNPSSTSARVQIPSELIGGTINVVSAFGQLVYTTTVPTTETVDIATSAIAPGMYWITMNNASLFYRSQLVICR